MWQYNQNELYHHGIKGQRWGVRRYQNPDGTLTARGRRRMEKLDRQYEKAFGRKSSYENAPEEDERYDPRINPKTKPGKLSDDELAVAIARLKLENTYKDLMNDVYPQPKLEKKKSLGKRFVDEALVEGLLLGSKDGIRSLTGDAVKELGTKVLKKNSKTGEKQTAQNGNKKKWDSPVVNTAKLYKKTMKQSGLDDILNDSMPDISNAAAKAKANYEAFTKINRKITKP